MIGLLSLLVACSQPPAPPVEPAPAPAPVAPAPAAVTPATWEAPPIEAIPEGPLGDSIKRGRDLFLKTNELLPEYATGNLTCGNCHLKEGRQLGAAALVGVHGRFPKYMERTGAVITLQDRVNYCFTRSLAGNRLPVDSQEMTDFMSYLAFLSEGAPAHGKVAGVDIPVVKGFTGDKGKGEALYVEKCQVCHQADGAGVRGSFPSLWGPGSYSIGASMAREERAASFIQQFMPQTAPGSLSQQEAFDLSAFINSHSRPDSPSKEKDWPTGGAPYDVPYATEGHPAYNPPEVLKRNSPETAVVPPPPSVRSAK
ncbi:MAG: c-type cytochrome [Myxococcota bacterium]